jgi:hypothetical protein
MNKKTVLISVLTVSLFFGLSPLKVFAQLLPSDFEKDDSAQQKNDKAHVNTKKINNVYDDFDNDDYTMPSINTINHTSLGLIFGAGIPFEGKKLMSGGAGLFYEQQLFSWLSFKIEVSGGIFVPLVHKQQIGLDNMYFIQGTPSLKFYPFIKYFYIEGGADFIYTFRSTKAHSFAIAPMVGVGFSFDVGDITVITIGTKFNYYFSNNSISYWVSESAKKSVFALQGQLGLSFKL